MHSFYRRARLSGLWDRILEHLVRLTRQKAGLSTEPTQALIDSQSVKIGNLLAVLVHKANLHDTKYAQMAVIAAPLSARLTNISA